MASKLEQALEELEMLLDQPLFQESTDGAETGTGTGTGTDQDGDEPSAFEIVQQRINNLIKKIREAVPEFFERLTGNSNEKLPEWVYKSVVGGLDSNLEYINNRMETETDSGRRLAIDILRQVVFQFRERIKSAAKYIVDTEKPAVTGADHDKDKPKPETAEKVEEKAGSQQKKKSS